MILNLPDLEVSELIELGTKPVFVPPYRIIPFKLKKLKDWLTKLLDKGFI